MTFLSFKVVWQASCPKIPKRLLNNLPDFTLVSWMPQQCPISRHNNTKSSFMLNSRQNTEFKRMMLLRSFSEFDWFMVQCAFFHSHVPAHRDLCVTVDALFTRILTSFLLSNNFRAKNPHTLGDTPFFTFLKPRDKLLFRVFWKTSCPKIPNYLGTYLEIVKLCMRNLLMTQASDLSKIFLDWP